MLRSRKRKRPDDENDAPEKEDEELWDLKDVIFIEDVRSVPVGKVVKVCSIIIYSFFSQ